MNVLNDSLYKDILLALEADPQLGLPGEGVSIINRGLSNKVSYIRNKATGRVWMRINTYGETYCVCCPYCGDTRNRLHINHAFGQYNKVTGSRHLELCHCFNEDCMSGDRARKEDLLNRMDRLYLRHSGALAPGNQRKPRVSLHGSALAEPRLITVPDDWPRIDQLPEDHPAAVFLSARGHDYKEVGRQFDARWIKETGRHDAKARRLLLHWSDDEKIVGWQARYVGDGDGRVQDTQLGHRYRCCECGTESWAHENPMTCSVCYGWGSIIRVTKWHTAAGTRTGHTLFNMPAASRWPYLVLMEGPMDVIRLGTPTQPDRRGPGVAVFCHSLGAGHQTKLQQWAAQQRRETGLDPVVFLVFDPDLWERPGKMEKLMAINQRLGELQIRPQLVHLADGKDPGDTEHRLLWEQIKTAATHAGLTPDLFTEQPLLAAQSH